MARDFNRNNHWFVYQDTISIKNKQETHWHILCQTEMLCHDSQEINAGGRKIFGRLERSTLSGSEELLLKF